MTNVLWLQGGACSGNTISFLNAEEPTVCDLIADFGINVLWHPSLGLELGDNLQQLLRDCISGKISLDILVFEGTVVNAPNGTGEWNRFADRPMKDWLTELAQAASFIVAVGDCATWGGIPAMSPNPSDSQGLQFLKREKGGFLGKDFRSKSGLPVINIPGCPAHPDWISQILVAIATGRLGDITLDELHRPQTFFKSFTQIGCTRNVHFAYKASTVDFGQRKGCLFYDLGCRGPMTHSSCNRILWNRVSSKTRAGMPCLGCTEPEFPFFDLQPGTVFKTQLYCTLWYYDCHTMLNLVLHVAIKDGAFCWVGLKVQCLTTSPSGDAPASLTELRLPPLRLFATTGYAYPISSLMLTSNLNCLWC